MYLIRKLCITLGSISKEGPYDFGFLSKSSFKTHTVMEDETWVFVRVVIMNDVCYFNAIINGALQSFQRWIKCSYDTHSILAADIEDVIEDRVDQRRLSNAGLDRSEHITESIDGKADISDEGDAEYICNISLFDSHEATLYGLLT